MWKWEMIAPLKPQKILLWGIDIRTIKGLGDNWWSSLSSWKVQRGNHVPKGTWDGIGSW
jgi:hypothetical protein